MASPNSIDTPELWELFALVSTIGEEGLDGYLARVLRMSAEWFLANRASIFLRVDQTERYDLTAVWGFGQTEMAGASIEEGNGIAGMALREGKPQLVQDPTELGITSVQQARIGSSMVIPLITIQTNKIGVLNLARGNFQPAFTEHDLANASAIAQVLALAVANARLFDEAHQNLNRATELHETLRTVVETAAFGLVVLSPEGLVTHCNALARADLSVEITENQPLPSFLKNAPDAFRATIENGVSRAMAGNEHQARVESDGRSWLVRVRPTPHGGVTVGLDETTQQERIQADVARIHRLAEIGQMSAAIAHEIRNPLTGILSSAQFIKTDPSVSAEFGAIIEQEARKLSRLCDEFLDFAKPISLNLQALRLSDVLARPIEMHRRDFEEKGVYLVLRPTPNEPVLRIDPLRIEQIARNLMINALHASSPGQTVMIETQGGTLSVEDEGVGMKPETVDKLFTPFFTTKPQGTGLGLSTVRKIIDAHRATIHVQSKLGIGTRFEIRFAPEAIH